MKEALRAFFYKPHPPEHPHERRRPGYFELEQRLNRFFIKALAAFAVIGLTSAVALLGFGLVLKSQAKTSEKIQDQRYKALVDICRDQNHRHDDVIKKIDDAVAAVPPPPRQQRKARESAKPFKLIISAAVPYQKDCAAYARNKVKGGT